MAELNASTESFITLLLEVSGRVRVSDLEAVGPDEAEGLLSTYVAAHPEKTLTFDGSTLMWGAAAAVAHAPAPPQPEAPAPAPVLVQPPFPERVEAPLVELAQPAQTEVSAAPPPASFEFGPDESFFNMPPFSGSADAPEGLVEPGTSSFFEAAEPEAVAATGPEPSGAAVDEPLDSVYEPIPFAAEASELAPRVPAAWWVLAVLFGLPGGLIGFFAFRKDNPEGARKVLIVGVAVTLVSVALFVAFLPVFSTVQQVSP